MTPSINFSTLWKVEAIDKEYNKYVNLLYGRGQHQQFKEMQVLHITSISFCAMFFKCDLIWKLSSAYFRIHTQSDPKVNIGGLTRLAQ